MKATLILAVVVLVGCAKEEPKPGANPSPPKLVAQEERASAAAEDSKAEAEVFLAEIEKNSQPLYDRAFEEVKKEVAEKYGDDVANKAFITPGKESLKILGPQKWMVLGQLKAKDHEGQYHYGSWEVTLQMMTDKLQVTSVRLDIRER